MALPQDQQPYLAPAYARTTVNLSIAHLAVIIGTFVIGIMMVLILHFVGQSRIEETMKEDRNRLLDEIRKVDVSVAGARGAALDCSLAAQACARSRN